MAGVLEFAIGLNSQNFVTGIQGMNRSISGFGPMMEGMNSGLARGGHEMIGMREKAEILRHSLESMGGSFGLLGEFARMALDPMTLGFAGLFAGIEYVNHALEESAHRMAEFQKSAFGVENIVREIIAARPTGTHEWAELLKLMAEAAGHNHQSLLEGLTGFSSRSDELQKGIDKNTNDAGQQELELEQKKIELLREQGQISEADAVKRIEALKDQAVLQKNLAEQKAIRDEISSKQSDLREFNRQAQQNPVDAALAKKQDADNRVNDLQKQIEDLPKAISGNERLQKEAAENAKRFYMDPHEKGRWQDQADSLGARNAQLRAQFDAAKSAFPGAVNDQVSANEGVTSAQAYGQRAKELSNTVADLNTQLKVTVDRQNKLTPLQLQQNQVEAAAKMAKPIGPAHVEDHTIFEKMGFIMGGGSVQNEQLSELRKMSRHLQQMAALSSPSNPGYTAALVAATTVNAV